MEAIQQFADRVDAAFTALGTSVDGLVTTSDGLVADAALLKKMIAELQASTGTVTAEDQARLDKIETAAGNLVSKVGGLAQKLADLDAATEPEVIPTPTP